MTDQRLPDPSQADPCPPFPHPCNPAIAAQGIRPKPGSPADLIARAKTAGIVVVKSNQKKEI
jgi:hypothetical protein